MPPASLNQIASFFLSVNGRVSRGEYVLGLVFIFALNAAIINFVVGQSTGGVTMGTLMLISLPFLPSQFIIAAKRCHDLGLPGLFVLLFLVPVFGFLWLLGLAVIPGNADANRYGPPPRFHPE